MGGSAVTVRVDEETGRRASRIAEDCGFAPSSVTRAFYRRMIRENAIPPRLSRPVLNDDSREAPAESERVLDSCGALRRPGRSSLSFWI
ncbi:type II toxin-antitoxin system RelB/DinJ family antitoxin [Actinomyces timonensis]|uniref:Type II toxin-antitoxin system RelB/DinJ family antitoxin n=1 Tax=Actinomyces timonensis TaxID=1288391 RepID=A0AAU8N6E1_9ACTO